jgi:hypothetical protein
MEKSREAGLDAVKHLRGLGFTQAKGEEVFNISGSKSEGISIFHDPSRRHGVGKIFPLGRTP